MSSSSLVGNNADLYERKDPENGRVVQLVPQLSNELVGHSISFLAREDRAQLAGASRSGYALVQGVYEREVLQEIRRQTWPQTMLQRLFIDFSQRGSAAGTAEAFRKAFSKPEQLNQFTYKAFVDCAEAGTCDAARLFLPLCAQDHRREARDNLLSCLEAIRQGDLGEAVECAHRIVPLERSWSCDEDSFMRMERLAVKALTQAGALEEAEELLNRVVAIVKQELLARSQRAEEGKVRRIDRLIDKVMDDSRRPLLFMLAFAQGQIRDGLNRRRIRAGLAQIEREERNQFMMKIAAVALVILLGMMMNKMLGSDGEQPNL